MSTDDDGVVLNTRIGEVVVTDSSRRWRDWIEFTRTVPHIEDGEHHLEATLEVGEEGVTVSTDSYGTDEIPEARAVAELVLWVCEIGELIEEANAEKIEKAREARRRKAEEEKRQREEREATVAKRKDLLMTGLLGEYVKIRCRGFKTFAAYKVDVYESSDGGFSLHLKPQSDSGYSRPHADRDVGRFVRLDVRTPDGFRTVWDDGTDDIPYYESPEKIKKPYPKWDGG